MSVTSQTPYKQFTAAPGATLFSTDFRVILASDLVVRKDGVVQPSGFTLSGLGNPSGLDVTFGVPMVGGEFIELLRQVPLTRLTDYQQTGDFLSPVVNNDFDRLWMAMQEQSAQLQGVLRAPYPESISDLPSAATRAGMALGFDLAGNPILLVPASAVTVALNVLIADLGNKYASATVEGALQEAATLAELAASSGGSLVGFLQSGTGAVGRTMLAKAREQISVLDFGAVGDGVADDTAAIQLALNYASLGGRTVYFPAGSYVISTSLTVTGNKVRVLLDHNASILHNTPDFMALRISGDNCIVEGGLGGGFIGPAAWDPGTGATTPTYAVIWVTGQNFTALNTRLYNIRRIGIGVKDVNNATVQGCVIDGNQPSPSFPLSTTFHFGVLFDPGTEASFGNFRAHDCRIKACTTGVFVGNYGVGQTAQGVVISDCLFDGMWDHGVYSNYTNGMAISGCAFNRCHVGVAASGRSNVITGCSFVTEKTTSLDPRDIAGAISLRDPENCVVSNISIRGNGDTVSGQTVIGVDLTNVSAVSMINNIVENITMLVATGKAQAVRISATTTHYGNIIRNVSYIGAVRDGLSVIEVGGSAGVQCQIGGIVARLLGGAGASGVVSASSLTQSQISDVNVWLEYSAPGAQTWFCVLLVSCVGVVVRDIVASAASGFGSNITLRGLTESAAASLNELHNLKLVQLSSLAAWLPVVAFSGTSLWINIAADAVPVAGYRAGSIYRRTASGGGGVYTVQTDGGAWTLLT